MRSRPSQAQLRQLQDQLAAQTRARADLIRQKSQQIMAHIPDVSAQAQRPKLQASQAELIERVQSHQRKRRAATAAIVAALLIVLLQTCEDDAPPAPEPFCMNVADCGPPPPKTNRMPRSPKARVRLGKSDRSKIELNPLLQPSWLADFRLQVSARSRSMGKCFQGAERPGALRFRAIVFPEKGTLAEPEIDSIVEKTPLTAEQKSCLIQTLSAPVYRLDGQSSDGLGQKVSIVFEF